jgi:diguanylate cyclase (GGDEF)-like protein
VRADVCKRVRVGIGAVRAWPLWELPRWLVAFIVAVSAVYVAAIALTAWDAAGVNARDLLTFAALLLCIATTVEMIRRAGEDAGVSKDVFAVWELPIAILLPPFYALLAPFLRLALTQWRVRQIRLYRRVFSAAAVGVSYGVASATFHALPPALIGPSQDPRTHVAVWLLAVAVAGAVQWAVNQLLVLPAIKGADPTMRIRDMLFERERVRNDIAEVCVAVLVTLGTAISLVTIVFALPFVTLLQRSVRHVQLLNASRIDSKTGLLNAGTWEREAASEVARAVRTRTPLALVLVDVDHFKLVNDVHGHLAGDRALRAIAHTFQIFLRSYDVAGRFGGEEFVLLLPQTSPADARQIAERVRAHIADMQIAISDDLAAEPVRVTVSMGVAALGRTWERTTGSQLTDLLAGADRALYQAKNAGRNHVVMVTDTATVGIVASPGKPPRISGLLSRWTAPARPASPNTPWWPWSPGGRPRSG